MSITDKLAKEQIAEGNLYKDARYGTIYCRLIYLTPQVAVLKTNESKNRKTGDVHRFEDRDDFNRMVSSGRLSQVSEDEIPDGIEAPQMPAEKQAEQVDFTEVDGVGDRTAEALNDAGISTDLDLQRVDDQEIIECYGMSERKLENIREYINA